MTAYRGLVYRAHTPKFAYAPLSGDGAAFKGGRFNPIGIRALYTSLDPRTTLLEMGHGFPARFDPKTVVCYDVDCSDIADLRTQRQRKALGVSLNDLACPWQLLLSQGSTPPSWKIAQDLISQGYAGILTPSFARGAKRTDQNLVLWDFGPDLPHKIVTYDPNNDLPKSPASWT